MGCTDATNILFEMIFYECCEKSAVERHILLVNGFGLEREEKHQRQATTASQEQPQHHAQKEPDKVKQKSLNRHIST